MSQTVDKGWSSSLGVGKGANNSSAKKSLLRNVMHTFKITNNEFPLSIIVANK